MSDGFQIFMFAVSPDSAADEAMHKLSDWLQAKRIGERSNRDDCDEDSSHLVPGLCAQELVIGGIAEAVSLQWNTIELKSGRHVGWSSMGVASCCPKCGSTENAEELFAEQLSDCIGKWVEGEAAIAVCPACSKASSIDEWDFGEFIALGNLSITFWNWPPLKLGVREMFEEITGAPAKQLLGTL
jgi:hypothetical protein